MNARLSPLKFLTAYNKRGATKNIQCPDKSLRCKAFRASFTLSAAGYVGPRDPIVRRQLPLGPGLTSAQPVALADDVRLPFRQALLHQLPHPDLALPGVQVVQHRVLHPDYIHEGEVVAVLVCLQGLGEGDLTLELFLATEEHEDLIFYTPCSIRRQPDIFLRLIAGDALNQPDGADGDQVVLVYGLGVIFLKRIPTREDFSRWKAASHGPPNFR